MTNLCRIGLSVLIIAINLLSCVLQWVCLFSRSDWLTDIRTGDSAFFTRLPYDSALQAIKTSFRAASFLSSSVFLKMGSVYSTEA